jgi:cyclic dehypoxanthinyl futalosine synthase
MDWNSAQALDALRGHDLLSLGISANQVRHNLHPEPVVTYELCGRTTSLEEAAREVILPGQSINLEWIRDIQHTTLDALKAFMVAQRKRLSEVTFQHLPVTRMMAAAEGVLPLVEALPGLQAAGLRSVSADFDPALSSLSSEELASLIRAATACGLPVSVSITIGKDESLEQRIGTLQVLRDLQQDSRSIQVVRVLVHHPLNPEARREEEATAVDYLKMLAVTRIFLDNVEHLQTDWSVMGPKVIELALRFGADDAGAIPWSQAGSPEPSHHGGESELRRIIRDAGFRPVERDALFRQSLLH